MTDSLHPTFFLCAVVALQGVLALWAHRVSRSVPTTLLVALLPPVGLPLLLWALRSRLHDNHIAGAITYLVLLGAALAFWYVKPPDEVPWMVMHTMNIFGFLGVTNIAATSLKE